MPKVISISGKIGAGKDYLADALIQELQRRGATVRKTHFGAALKQELNQAISFVREHSDSSLDTIARLVSEEMGMSETEAWSLIIPLVLPVTGNSDLNAYDKSVPEIRDALQKLGTDIRRGQNPTYWSDTVADQIRLMDEDYVIIADNRFINEAETVKNLGGVCLRLDIPEATLHQRRLDRDGVTMKYSVEQIQHPSEMELDDYEGFDRIVGERFDVEELLNGILEMFWSK